MGIFAQMTAMPIKRRLVIFAAFWGVFLGVAGGVRWIPCGMIPGWFSVTMKLGGFLTLFLITFIYFWCAYVGL